MYRQFTRPSSAAFCCALLLQCALIATSHAQAFGSFASVDVTACTNPAAATAGGSGTISARVQRDADGPCTANVTGRASATGIADLATGRAFASAHGMGSADDVRAIGRSSYTELVTIENVPKGVDSVSVRASIEFIVAANGSFESSTEFLFGRITVPGGGDIELRRCSAQLCPDDPIAADFTSQDYVVPRNSATGEFPRIGVAANVIIDVMHGGGYFVARTLVEVIDDSGATIGSASGVYGSEPNTDTDQDGVADSLDNCVSIANPDQRDTDGDTFGNRCDPDLNNDLVVDAADLGLLRLVFFSADPDADFNNDGVVNVVDLGILRSFFFDAPGNPQ